MPSVNADPTAAISPRTGIIHALFEVPFHHDDPAVHIYGTLMADTSRFSSHKCSSRNGGAGLTREQAIGAAIGESLERYCCSFCDRDRLKIGSFDDFRGQAIEPAAFILYSTRQYGSDAFPYSEFGSETKIAWVEAKSLISGQTKLVPASMVYLPYYGAPGETLISQGISTGLACRETETAAILSGVYECIERDAFTIYWLNALRVPRIEPSQMPDDQLRKFFFERFARSGIRYFIWNITSDIEVPSFFCVAIGPSDIGQLCCVGSASHLDASHALLKTLIEASQERPYLRFEHVRDPDWHCKEDFSNIRNFDDHARVYTDRPDLIRHLDFCTTYGGHVAPMPPNGSAGDAGTDLRKLLSMLDARGFDVLVVDLTTEDVRELGLHVVRVVIPGLQPLHGDHRLPFLGGRRLYETPVRRGLLKRPLTEDEIFKLPHPFP